MKYVNNTAGRIKVPVEDTDPKQWKTLYPEETIECEDESILNKGYIDSGLVLANPPKLAEKEKRPEVKAVESKSGIKKVETKQVEKD